MKTRHPLSGGKVTLDVGKIDPLHFNGMSVIVLDWMNSCTDESWKNCKDCPLCFEYIIRASNYERAKIDNRVVLVFNGLREYLIHDDEIVYPTGVKRVNSIEKKAGKKMKQMKIIWEE